MTTDRVTPQAEVRGSAVDGDTSLPGGETKETAMPTLDHIELKARVNEILNRGSGGRRGP